MSINITLYVIDLYLFFPEESFLEWQGGAAHIIKSLKNIDHNYDKVLVSNELIDSYIFFAFYYQIGPLILNKAHMLDNLNQISSIQIIRVNECSLLNPNTLVISHKDLSSGLSTTISHKPINHFSRFAGSKPFAYSYDTNHFSNSELFFIRDKCKD